jgi:hypothetical protein
MKSFKDNFGEFYAFQPFDNFDDFPIDKNIFSAFKYGCADATAKLTNLFSSGIENLLADVSDRGDPICCTAAPFNFLKTASNHLLDQIIFNINLKRSFQRIPSIRIIQVNKKNSNILNYSELDVSCRTSLEVAHTPFSTNFSFVNSKLLLILDDLRITGQNELRFRRLFNEHQNIQTKYVYLAALNQTSSINPSVENKINEALFENRKIKLIDFINERYRAKVKFLLNVRLAKAILQLPPGHINDLFDEGFGGIDVGDFLRLSLLEGYHTHERMRNSFLSLLRISEFQRKYTTTNMT